MDGIKNKETKDIQGDRPKKIFKDSTKENKESFRDQVRNQAAATVTEKEYQTYKLVVGSNRPNGV